MHKQRVFFSLIDHIKYLRSGVKIKHDKTILHEARNDAVSEHLKPLLNVILVDDHTST